MPLFEGASGYDGLEAKRLTCPAACVTGQAAVFCKTVGKYGVPGAAQLRVKERKQGRFAQGEHGGCKPRAVPRLNARVQQRLPVQMSYMHMSTRDTCVFVRARSIILQ